jgi:protein-S-isoprenylcysteine O-methyltransferase Ste14
MRPYFAGQPLQSVLFGITMLIWMSFEVRQALKRRPGASSDDRGSLMLLRVWIFIAVALAYIAVSRVPSATLADGAPLFAAGLALMWCGITLRLWSFRTLGRYFTFTVMTSPDQRVVTSGPYRFLRHPSYLGIALVLTGIGATYANWLSLAVLACIPLVGLIYRIRVEESALSSTLGSAYTAYATGRKRLIPFVW